MSDKPRRWWLPRYTLRTLFVVVTLVAVAMGWLGYHLNWIRQRHEFSASLAERRKQLKLSAEAAPPKGGHHSSMMPWGLRLLGEPQCASIELIRLSGKDDDRLNPGMEDAEEVRRARSLFPESQITVLMATGDEDKYRRQQRLW